VKIDDKDFNGYVECIVAKQNNRPTRPIPLRFVEKFARFEPQDPDQPFLSTGRTCGNTARRAGRRMKWRQLCKA
jgi:hypothetical protein